jgi:hypothetical protein
MLKDLDLKIDAEVVWKRADHPMLWENERSDHFSPPALDLALGL